MGYELPAVQVSDSHVHVAEPKDTKTQALEAKNQAMSTMLEEVHSSRQSANSKTSESQDKAVEETGNAAAQGAKSGADALGALRGALKNAQENTHQSGSGDGSTGIESIAKGAVEQGLKGLSEAVQGKEYFQNEISKLSMKVTEKDRKEAKEKLDGQLSNLIPEQDRKLLSDMQNAIVDGDVNAFAKAVQALKNQPEKLKAFVKEIEKSLKETDANTHIAVSKDGKVLLYQNFGSTAVEVGTDGSVGVRPISARLDGSAVLEPGEVLNKEPGDCMKDISEDMVRNVTRPFRFDNYIKPLYKEPMYKLFQGEPNLKNIEDGFKKQGK